MRKAGAANDAERGTAEMEWELVQLADRPECLRQAAVWFCEKWGIPQRAYEESMTDSLHGEKAVPQWYLALREGQIIGGLGVIENDFHDRKDLASNVCAVYTQPAFHGRGVARSLLRYVCVDMKERGVPVLYFVTDHTSFYERCGWRYLCMAQCDGDETPSRVYTHREE